MYVCVLYSHILLLDYISTHTIHLYTSLNTACLLTDSLLPHYTRIIADPTVHLIHHRPCDVLIISQHR